MTLLEQVTPSAVGNWTSLGVGFALIGLVSFSIFKLIDAWIKIASERQKENQHLQELNDMLRKENDRLRDQLYGKRPRRDEDKIG